MLDRLRIYRLQYLIPRIILLTCLYITVARVGLLFTAKPDIVSPVWPLSGIVFAILLRGGLRLWPGIFLGELLTGLWIGIPLGTELGIAICTTLEIVLGILLLRPLIGSTLQFDSLREVVAFITVTTLVSVPLAGSGATILLTINQAANWSYAWQIWRAWWVGDVMGILAVTPMLLSLQYLQLESLRWAELAERVALYGLLMLASSMVMRGLFNYSYVLLVFVIWAALRFGPRGTATAITIICAITVWLTTLGEGPFVISVLGENLFFLQTFLMVVTITGLIVSALVAERHRSTQITQLMADVAVDVVQSSEEPQMLQAVTRRLADWADGCSITLLELDGKLHTVAAVSTNPAHTQLLQAWTQEPASSELASHTLLSAVIQGRQAILISEDWQHKHKQVTQTEAYAQLSEALQPRMLIVAPLMTYSHPLGMLMLFSSNPARVYHENDLPCVQEIADRIALSITTTRLSDDMVRSQRLDALGHLANSVAHDFNNLLTAILGHSEMMHYMLERDHPASIDLDSIISAAKLAQTLVGELRTIGYHGPAVMRPMSLNLLVQQVAVLLRSLIRHPVEIVYELAPDLGLCSIDPAQFERVIVNLATNARDAMPAGGQMTIRTGSIVIGSGMPTPPDLQAGRYVYLSVQDTGSGIAPEIMAHIFEPYFTTKARDMGSGLGLSISYGIVRALNGTITAHSEPGQGALFTIYLPEISMPADHEEPVFIEADK